jgi:hypothetical protein
MSRLNKCAREFDTLDRKYELCAEQTATPSQARRVPSKQV